jgi:hypothetical protein
VVSRRVDYEETLPREIGAAAGTDVSMPRDVLSQPLKILRKRLSPQDSRQRKKPPIVSKQRRGRQYEQLVVVSPRRDVENNAQAEKT